MPARGVATELWLEKAGPGTKEKNRPRTTRTTRKGKEHKTWGNDTAQSPKVFHLLEVSWAVCILVFLYFVVSLLFKAPARGRRALGFRGF